MNSIGYAPRVFCVMLVFSNAIISYSSLFRSKETQWLLTLPIDHRALFSWKVVETILVSSWGLVFLSAPLLQGMLEGGVPILVDGQVIGAVGVSGVKSTEDAQIARAGISALVP